MLRAEYRPWPSANAAKTCGISPNLETLNKAAPAAAQERNYITAMERKTTSPALAPHSGKKPAARNAFCKYLVNAGESNPISILYVFCIS